MFKLGGVMAPSDHSVFADTTLQPPLRIAQPTSADVALFRVGRPVSRRRAFEEIANAENHVAAATF